MTIAVNGAIDWLDHADYFFTLDLSPENITRCLNQKPGTIYCAAVDEHKNAPPKVVKYIRVSHRGPEPKRKKSPAWWLWRWSGVPGLQTRPGYISTGNSAYGALNLAYHMGAYKIALFGVDGSEDERCEGGYSRNLSHLPLLFGSAAHQVNAVNCGQLKCPIPTMSPADGIKWLVDD